MTHSSQPHMLNVREKLGGSLIDNPFIRRPFQTSSTFCPQEYIEQWITNILYQGKKIDSEARSSIYSQLSCSKNNGLVSCSEAYTIMREAVEIVSKRLRQFIDSSYQILHKTNVGWCNLNDNQTSWSRNWTKFKHKDDPEFLRNIYPTVGKMFVLSYRYICQASRQIVNLWKILHELIPVKDLRLTTLPNAINDLILQIFTQTSSSFIPKHMLPTLSFSQKCRFIYSQVEGIVRREQVTRFYEDDMVRILAPRKDEQVKFNSAQELRKIKTQHNCIEKSTNVFKRFENLHKTRVGTSLSNLDQKYIETLRNCYIQNEFEMDQPQPIFDIEAGIDFFQLEGSDFTVDRQPVQEKKELIQTMESNKDVLFEVDDTSSIEEGDSDPDWGRDDEDSDQQCLQNNCIELTNKHTLLHMADDNIINSFVQGKLGKLNPQKAEAQLGDHKAIFDFNNDTYTLSHQNYSKKYRIDFPLTFSCRTELKDFDISEARTRKQERRVEYETNEKDFQLTLEDDMKINLEQTLKEGISEKMSRLRQSITKSKECLRQDKKVQYIDKKKLEQQKLKLEKYRKELEKEKEELLREVQKFMKEKRKEENLLMLMKETKGRSKYHRNNKPCNCQSVNYKIMHKLEEHQQKLESITLKYEQADKHAEQAQMQIQMQIPLESPLQSSSSSTIPDVPTDQPKMSKKQQKLRKKIERQIREGTLPIEKLERQDSRTQSRQKAEKVGLCQQEACLSNFLERLQISDLNRVACNVQEDRIDKWKVKREQIRNGTLPVKSASPSKMPSSSSPKKKKKSRR